MHIYLHIYIYIHICLYIDKCKTNVAGNFPKLIFQHFGSSNLKEALQQTDIKGVMFNNSLGHNKSVLGKAKINPSNLPQHQLRTMNCFQ